MVLLKVRFVEEETGIVWTLCKCDGAITKWQVEFGAIRWKMWTSGPWIKVRGTCVGACEMDVHTTTTCCGLTDAETLKMGLHEAYFKAVRQQQQITKRGCERKLKVFFFGYKWGGVSCGARNTTKMTDRDVEIVEICANQGWITDMQILNRHVVHDLWGDCVLVGWWLDASKMIHESERFDGSIYTCRWGYSTNHFGDTRGWGTMLK